MVCELCHTNHATIHITEVLNNQKKELHLCDECAKQKGVTTKIQLSLADLVGGLVEPPKVTRQQRELMNLKCVNCGLTFQDLRQKVRLGCANCLEVFKDWLALFIEKIHGSTQHVGKVPKNADQNQKRDTELLKLKKELDEAVRKEDFELAARIRDKIRAMDADVGRAR
jgi:protein arginine kinase activator